MNHARENHERVNDGKHKLNILGKKRQTLQNELRMKTTMSFWLQSNSMAVEKTLSQINMRIWQVFGELEASSLFSIEIEMAMTAQIKTIAMAFSSPC